MRNNGLWSDAFSAASLHLWINPVDIRQHRLMFRLGYLPEEDAGIALFYC